MICGQYVVTASDNRTWQLFAMNGPTRGYAGLQHLDPPTVYTLVDPLTREVRRVVWETARPHNGPAGMAMPERFDLTPACGKCDVPAGYCYGDGHHYSDVMAARTA